MAPADKATVLVVGSGGREHAIAWKLASSELVGRVICAPGNGGTELTDKAENVAIKVDDFEGIARLCLDRELSLAVIGPDNPLADGIVDFLEARGIVTFGPTKAQARLEASKAHAKEFMTALGIPTARYLATESYKEARDFVRANSWARVVKADGLALGKGVFVCDDESEALSALSTIFKEERFGAAGQKVVIEEKLVGEELSVLLIADGKTLELLPVCQDHKRRFDGDRGPNTGGMGAYSPVPLFTKCKSEIYSQVIEPLRRGLRTRAFTYKGILYAGILVTAQEQGAQTRYTPYVLEFNARFGDPETQVIMPLLDCDLYRLLKAAAQGRLSQEPPVLKSEAACCVVVCGKDYPESGSKDKPIAIAGTPEHSVIFHAGTKNENGKLLTAGGRVLAVTATAGTLEQAVERAYSTIDSIKFEEMDFRKDIARRSLAGCR